MTNYPTTPPPGNMAPPPGYGAPQAKNNDATTALIAGIVSIFCFGIIVGPFAIIQGFKGRKVAATLGGNGDGMALAGIICGGIGLVLNLVGILYFVAL